MEMVIVRLGHISLTATQRFFLREFSTMRFIHWPHIHLMCVAASIVLAPVSSASAADHLDSPSVQSNHSLDINDLYAFQSPSNPNNIVLVMTVNPLAGVLSGTAFSSAGIYEFGIDNNGNAIPDKTFTVYFSAVKNGSQNVLVLRANGSILASGKTEQTIAIAGGGKLRAGVFDDPFFFDLNGFNDNFSFTGSDFFAGMNVSAIVLEIPRTELGGVNVGVSARTAIGGTQFDRMGRPAINTVLLTGVRKDAFNAGTPASDYASFHVEVEAKIASLNGGDTATAAALAGILLPDLLTVDASSSAGFLNGRQPANDVIDAELNLLTNGGLTTDMVNANDVSFLTAFPYLAPKH
jgi:hypothetical protein